MNGVCGNSGEVRMGLVFFLIMIQRENNYKKSEQGGEVMGKKDNKRAVGHHKRAYR